MPLYPYQERVKELIQAGNSVILQAPTGAGKTRAALAPFIENFFDRADGTTPRKCIYSVPMRVLANQFESEYGNLAGAYQRINRREIKVTIQTGEQPKDRQFEGDLIFCTIDQFLSSYLSRPYGLPRRLANINAGAFVGTYLVFDEFHLLDPDSTLPTTLYAIKRLSRVAPVLLMTATFSSSVLYALKKEIHNAEVVLVDREEARSIETSFGEKEGRQRIWQTSESTLSANVVLEKHKKRSLAICNTVRKAQELYRELRKSLKGKDIDVLLLHSRFLQEDRQTVEREIKERFKCENSEGSIIAVATQTIEVGVDITSEILHTELAPASALIQRAGRCARYPGELGQVIVYHVEKLSPYGGENENSLWGKEMIVAFDWLKEHNNEIFDFKKEQDFVNAVAKPRDKKVLLQLSAGAPLHAEAIHNVLIGTGNADASRLLIRDADSKLVLIHPDPDELTLNPYLAKGFNIQTRTLFGMVKEWLDRDIDIDWRVKRLIGDEIYDKEESNHTEYGWERLSDLSQLTATQVIVVNPELAGYLKDEGFVADQGSTSFISTLSDFNTHKEYSGFSYKLEEYEDHIRCVLDTFQDISMMELVYSAQALEQTAGWSQGSVMRALWLACLFHDVGKLSAGWQEWARAYQRRIGMPVSNTFAAGHTEHEWGNQMHREAEKTASKKHAKPNHAGESALATAKVIARSFSKTDEGLVKAILTAITRHHTPFANECKTYVLEEQADGHISTTLNYVPEEIRKWVNLELLKTESKTTQNSFTSLLIAPDDTFGWMAYALLARALRRSDQEGTARGTRKEA